MGQFLSPMFTRLLDLTDGQKEAIKTEMDASREASKPIQEQLRSIHQQIGDAANLVDREAHRDPGAIVLQAHNLAQIRLHVLRRVELLPISGADEQVTVGRECKAMPEVTATFHLRHLAPDDLQTG